MKTDQSLNKLIQFASLLDELLPDHEHGADVLRLYPLHMYFGADRLAHPDEFSQAAGIRCVGL